MSRIVKREIAHIDLGDGDWVDVRKKLDYGARASMQEKLISNLTPAQLYALEHADEDNGPKVNESELRLNLRDSNIEALVQSVVAWGGPGFCSLADHPSATHEGECVPLPITWENVSGLDESAERILLELKRIMVTKTPDFTPPLSPITSMARAEVTSSGDSQI